MGSRIKDIIVIAVVILLLALISFPFNSWFSATMPRHQAMQLPAALLLGLVSSRYFSNAIKMDSYWGTSAFIYFIFSLSFWMLPHSIDKAVISPSFNRMMIVNLFTAGFFIGAAYKSLVLELKIFLLGMIAGMVTATGYTLMHYDVLLCSSFDIIQQRYTGRILLIVGLCLVGLTLFTFFRRIGKD